MKQWNQRPLEVAYLLNPAFCGEIIRRCIKKYQDTLHTSFPYALIFLILPIVLHKNTRTKINSRIQMHVFIKKNPDVRITYAERARQLILITKEALLFLLLRKAVIMNEYGELSISKYRRKKVKGEVAECFQVAEVVGRWFSRAGTVNTIYTMWGVKP